VSPIQPTFVSVYHLCAPTEDRTVAAFVGEGSSRVKMVAHNPEFNHDAEGGAEPQLHRRLSAPRGCPSLRSGGLGTAHRSHGPHSAGIRRAVGSGGPHAGGFTCRPMCPSRLGLAPPFTGRRARLPCEALQPGISTARAFPASEPRAPPSTSRSADLRHSNVSAALLTSCQARRPGPPIHIT
jgi:hypothetical protein